MARGSTQQAKLGPNIVRAWFDSVVNPVIRAMETEESFLARQDWTWRFRPKSFERLRSVKSWIEPRQRENFKHFLSLNPPVGDLANLHDKALFELLQACSDYSEALVKSARFRELYEESVSPDSLKQLGAASPQEFFGAYPTEDHLALLAEKVINNVGDLPSYHTVARLWNQRRDVFLASREWPEITKRHQRTLKAGRNLREAAGRLREFLEERRLELSLEYDVPPVSVRQLVENEGFPE